MNRFTFFVSVLAVVFVAAILPSISQASHPSHVSSAEVNWNPKSGNFEVALCVWPTDLEKALAKDQSKIIDLDKVENLDEIIKSYVEKKFLIRRAGADQSKNETELQQQPDPSIRWVGHERDNKAAWLFFEIEGDKSGAEWTIENRIFFELNEDQLNQIQTSVGEIRDTVVCRVGSFRHSIDTIQVSNNK